MGSWSPWAVDACAVGHGQMTPGQLGPGQSQGHCLSDYGPNYLKRPMPPFQFAVSSQDAALGSLSEVSISWKTWRLTSTSEFSVAIGVFEAIEFLN